MPWMCNFHFKEIKIRYESERTVTIEGLLARSCRLLPMLFIQRITHYCAHRNNFYVTGTIVTILTFNCLLDENSNAIANIPRQSGDLHRKSYTTLFFFATRICSILSVCIAIYGHCCSQIVRLLPKS